MQRGSTGPLDHLEAMTPSYREPEQETMNELETIAFTVPLDRPEPLPKNRLERAAKPQAMSESRKRIVE